MCSGAKIQDVPTRLPLSSARPQPPSRTEPNRAEPSRAEMSLRGWALAVLAALTPAERSRPYAVLQKQNLVLLGSILSALLLTIVLMAVCVYKPVRRR